MGGQITFFALSGSRSPLYLRPRPEIHLENQFSLSTMGMDRMIKSISHVWRVSTISSSSCYPPIQLINCSHSMWVFLDLFNVHGHRDVPKSWRRQAMKCPENISLSTTWQYVRKHSILLQFSKHFSGVGSILSIHQFFPTQTSLRVVQHHTPHLTFPPVSQSTLIPFLTLVHALDAKHNMASDRSQVQKMQIPVMMNLATTTLMAVTTRVMIMAQKILGAIIIIWAAMTLGLTLTLHMIDQHPPTKRLALAPPSNTSYILISVLPFLPTSFIKSLNHHQSPGISQLRRRLLSCDRRMKLFGWSYLLLEHMEHWQGTSWRSPNGSRLRYSLKGPRNIAKSTARHNASHQMRVYGLQRNRRRQISKSKLQKKLGQRRDIRRRLLMPTTVLHEIRISLSPEPLQVKRRLAFKISCMCLAFQWTVL